MKSHIPKQKPNIINIESENISMKTSLKKKFRISYNP